MGMDWEKGNKWFPKNKMMSARNHWENIVFYEDKKKRFDWHSRLDKWNDNYSLNKWGEGANQFFLKYIEPVSDRDEFELFVQ
jgi:hypothetical protein